jgi:CHASE3 domain sensor protein
MSRPFFWRFILGGAGLLSLSTAACLYSIVQLSTLSARAREALDTDHKMINFQEALTDTFLSEVRYSGKYIISRKEDRYDQLLPFKNDFARHLSELRSRRSSEKVTNHLSKIDRIHDLYHRLFDQEVAYIRANQNYAQSRYEQERNKLVESGLNELERLKAELRLGLQQKLENMDRSARTARTITITTTAIVMLFGVFVLVKFSGGNEMVRKPDLRLGAALSQVARGVMSVLRSQYVALGRRYKILEKKAT